jgi:hypothetical protein
MSKIKDPEWIAMQNTEWIEEDQTWHRISKYDPLLNQITYSVNITMPITNKKFHSTTIFRPLELTNSVRERISKIAKQNLTQLMLEELTKTK